MSRPSKSIIIIIVTNRYQYKRKTNNFSFVLAVATTFTEQKVNPAVSFYNLKTLSLMSTFEEPEDEYPEDIEQYQRRRFTKLRFLNDNENITVLAVSESDSILYYYNWNFNVIDVSVQIDNPVADVRQYYGDIGVI